MAFRWLLHSACHVIGSPKDTTKLHTNEEQRVQGDDHHVISSLKVPNNGGLEKHPSSSGFQMPLHYPRYKKADYEKMEEWKVELLLKQYGLSFEGTLDEKRAYAMGAFMWPDQF
ncbi:hypothetical protein FH972_000053 [Carpinus fangiana]|uniref:DUF7722 domain-containing protein n=1 Tax=Carpinus fangiana TaxID=176857 RepID=A0A5N6Q7N3_9ROSI|nr:hypothetical protein FH972_000053 [Carpinus fangiana]